jgi:excisionase family DNA binding protein
MENSHLVDVNEGTRITGLRPQTIYKLARHGRIRSFKVLGRSLRFERAELLGLVSERMQPEPESAA